MTGMPFEFAGLILEARPSGALFWPERRWLIVADLHLGKSERMARRGGPLLPPYEIQATLDRLAAEIAATNPLAVISLGDAFDDDSARQSLDAGVCAVLYALALGRDWIWITGNHDPGPVDLRLPGRSINELCFDMLGLPTFRHEAGAGSDISGHYHPCIRLAGDRRRCFLVGQDHLILPAFGAYTGGLSVDDPALRRLVPTGIAIACGLRMLRLPVGLSKAGRRR